MNRAVLKLAQSRLRGTLVAVEESAAGNGHGKTKAIGNVLRHPFDMSHTRASQAWLAKVDQQRIKPSLSR